jgi:DNA-binding response OmpR family regulator
VAPDAIHLARSQLTVIRMATVALVACEPDIERLLADALRDDGHLVHALPLHGGTVSLLAKLRLDAVLLDGHPYTDLPRMLEALREQHATKRLPAVVVTAKERRDLHGLGWVEQIEMPFDLADLLAAIGRAAVASGSKKE